MKRTALASGILLPALVGVLPACDDPFTCPASFTDCGGVCIDLAVDENNCGVCGTTCDTDESCVANTCAPNLVCNAPEENCGNVCINTQTSAEHCGGCGDACAGTFDACVAGQCASPLVAMHTWYETKGTFDRDLYVLQDRTFTLTKLNTGDFFSDRVIDHAVLPDGRILLVATLDETVYELYLASPLGGELTKLSGTPSPGFGGVLRGLVVSTDGSRVLYRADVDGLTELYTVALTATPSAPVKVSGPLIEGGGVASDFELSADGTGAAYLAAQDTPITELYYVDLSGSTPAAPVKLNHELPDPDGVWDFVMAADGFRIVYRAEDPGLGRLQLYTIHVTRPATPDVITYADGAEGTVVDYTLTPDGTGLAFTAYDDGLWDETLWYLDLAAPYDATLVVSAGEAFAGIRDDFAFTPDGNTLLYRKMDDDTFAFDRLYRVDITDAANPGIPELLSAEGTSSAEEVADFAISPDGTSVVYRGGADGAEGNPPYPGSQGPERAFGRAPVLYHVDLTAATPAPSAISAPVPAKHEGIAGGYVVTGDNARVVFLADYDNAFRTDAYLVSFDDAAGVRRVSPPLDDSDESDVARLTRF